MSAKDFLDAYKSFYSLLGAVSGAICESDKQKPKWEIRVRSGSNVVEFKNRNQQSTTKDIGSIGTLLVDGANALKLSVDPPENFPESAIEKLRDLSDLSAKKTGAITVNFWAKDKQCAVTPQIRIGAGRLLDPMFEDYGSIEGRLDGLHAHGKLEIVVWESVFDRAIKCVVSEKLLDQAINHFRQRVEVHGRIKYRKDGLPVNVKVHEFEAFPENENIPNFRAMKGIFGTT